MPVPLVLNLSMNCAGSRQCRFRDFWVIHESKGGGRGGPFCSSADPADHRVPFGGTGMGGQVLGLSLARTRLVAPRPKYRLPGAGVWLWQGSGSRPHPKESYEMLWMKPCSSQWPVFLWRKSVPQPSPPQNPKRQIERRIRRATSCLNTSTPKFLFFAFSVFFFLSEVKGRDFVAD